MFNLETTGNKQAVLQLKWSVISNCQGDQCKKKMKEQIINVRDYINIRARHPLLIAHRGGVITPNTPENSLASIQLAEIYGYDMVELDIWEAKDHEPILFHDVFGSNLFINCGIAQTVEDLTSNELLALCYQASTEHIATLAQALALCRSLNLGVMLDIKIGQPSVTFLKRIADLLKIYHLCSASITISHHPLVKRHLAKSVIFPVSEQNYQRVVAGEKIELHQQYWFGWASKLPDAAVKLLHQNGAFVLPAINTFHYPAHARRVLANQDAERL